MWSKFSELGDLLNGQDVSVQNPESSSSPPEEYGQEVDLRRNHYVRFTRLDDFNPFQGTVGSFIPPPNKKMITSVHVPEVSKDELLESSLRRLKLKEKEKERESKNVVSIYSPSLTTYEKKLLETALTMSIDLTKMADPSIKILQILENAKMVLSAAAEKISLRCVVCQSKSALLVRMHEYKCTKCVVQSFVENLPNQVRFETRTCSSEEEKRLNKKERSFHFMEMFAHVISARTKKHGTVPIIPPVPKVIPDFLCGKNEMKFRMNQWICPYKVENLKGDLDEIVVAYNETRVTEDEIEYDIDGFITCYLIEGEIRHRVTFVHEDLLHNLYSFLYKGYLRHTAACALSSTVREFFEYEVTLFLSVPMEPFRNFFHDDTIIPEMICNKLIVNDQLTSETLDSFMYMMDDTVLSEFNEGRRDTLINLLNSSDHEMVEIGFWNSFLVNMSNAVMEKIGLSKVQKTTFSISTLCDSSEIGKICFGRISEMHYCLIKTILSRNVSPDGALSLLSMAVSSRSKKGVTFGGWLNFFPGSTYSNSGNYNVRVQSRKVLGVKEKKTCMISVCSPLCLLASKDEVISTVLKERENVKNVLKRLVYTDQ